MRRVERRLAVVSLGMPYSPRPSIDRAANQPGSSGTAAATGAGLGCAALFRARRVDDAAEVAVFLAACELNVGHLCLAGCAESADKLNFISSRIQWTLAGRGACGARIAHPLSVGPPGLGAPRATAVRAQRRTDGPLLRGRNQDRTARGPRGCDVSHPKHAEAVHS
jgi:hypothetical protein